MEPTLPADAPAAPKLLDEVCARIRVGHYSIRTEDQYVQWIKRFVIFRGKRHPRDLGASGHNKPLYPCLCCPPFTL